MAGHERRKPMKFSDMPYERVDFEKVGQELSGLIRELGEAKNGEEQFAVHQRYYALTDHVYTLMTIVIFVMISIQWTNFMKKSANTTMRCSLFSRTRCWNICKSCMNPPTGIIWRAKSAR